MSSSNLFDEDDLMAAKHIPQRLISFPSFDSYFTLSAEVEQTVNSNQKQAVHQTFHVWTFQVITCVECFDLLMLYGYDS